MAEQQAGEQDFMRQRLKALGAKCRVQEPSFTSDKPFIGRLVIFVREKWNSVATKWYVRPMLQQQNRFNREVVQMLEGILDQLEELDQWLVGTDRDLTQVARTTAQDEYRLQKWRLQAKEERKALAMRLSQLEKMLAQGPQAPDQEEVV